MKFMSLLRRSRSWKTMRYGSSFLWNIRYDWVVQGALRLQGRNLICYAEDSLAMARDATQYDLHHSHCHSGCKLNSAVMTSRGNAQIPGHAFQRIEEIATNTILHRRR